MTYSPPAGEITATIVSEIYTIRYDDVGSGVAYVGEAVPGTALNAALWRIKKIAETGDDIAITYADGNDNFDNIWNNRLSIVYS